MNELHIRSPILHPPASNRFKYLTITLCRRQQPISRTHPLGFTWRRKDIQRQMQNERRRRKINFRCVNLFYVYANLPKSEPWLEKSINFPFLKYPSAEGGFRIRRLLEMEECGEDERGEKSISLFSPSLLDGGGGGGSEVENIYWKINNLTPLNKSRESNREKYNISRSNCCFDLK